jgi:hypothetical protein
MKFLLLIGPVCLRLSLNFLELNFFLKQKFYHYGHIFLEVLKFEEKKNFKIIKMGNKGYDTFERTKRFDKIAKNIKVNDFYAKITDEDNLKIDFTLTDDIFINVTMPTF